VIRVLFVDDDTDLLSALARMLRTRRDRWAMTFASSGRQALEVLSDGDFDVVVSDMMMPGMDGASLLAEVRVRFPSVVRIVLSGQTHLGGAARDVIEAHQFLAKPCEANRLESAIERSLTLRARLSDPALLELVGGMNCLPSPSTTVIALREELAAEQVNVSKVNALISSDIAVSAKILQLVNSAFFGLPRSLSDISEAVTYLGTQALGELVMSAAVFRSLAHSAPRLEAEIERVQQRGISRASLAADLAEMTGRSPELCRNIWTGAFLADVGDLVLLTSDVVLTDTVAEGLLAASLGAHLMSMWGLPHHLVETAALSRDHIDPTSGDGAAFTWIARRLLTGSSDHVAVSDSDLAVVGLTGADIECVCGRHGQPTLERR
jgi:HD-like signal output (HDOD) protein/CheY-like chemotaxis protein